MMALLSLHNVSNTYRSRALGAFGAMREKQILKGVDLEIREGELFGLVGESGCGKTTLSRCILGLIDYTGEISIQGEALRPGRRAKDFSRQVQAVFQNPASALNPVKTIGWLLEEPLRSHSIGSKATRQAIAADMLSMVGLDPSYRNRRVAELSGGQKQRVCIAGALMLQPSLVIADEPVSSLDVSVGAQILNLFRELHEKLRLSLLFISHDLNLVYYLCDRIAVMCRGQIVETGTAEAVYQNPGHPYTQDLLGSMPMLFGEMPTLIRGKGIADTPCPYSDRCRFKTRACTEHILNIAEASEEPHWVRCDRSRE